MFYFVEKRIRKKRGIKEIEIFMNCIFIDLFKKLHEQECIDDYETLIKFENELDILIQGKFDQVKEEIGVNFILAIINYFIHIK